jgi:transposase
MLPNKPRGVRRANDRRVLNGVFWILRSGAPWRDLPETYGPRTACYNRFVRWRRAGVWDRIMDALAAGHDAADRGYDADWIRQLVGQQGAWANILPKRNRKAPICFTRFFIARPIWAPALENNSGSLFPVAAQLVSF